jgi:hypothetical protein
MGITGRVSAFMVAANSTDDALTGALITITGANQEL